MRHLRSALHLDTGHGRGVSSHDLELNDDVDAGGWLRRLKVPVDRYVGALAAAASEDAAARKDGDGHTAGESLRCHAHVHVGRAGSAGGNMWKYIATAIGMKTIVL